MSHVIFQGFNRLITSAHTCSEDSDGGTASDGGWDEGGPGCVPLRLLRPPRRFGVPPEALLGASDGAGVPTCVPPGVMLTWRSVFSDWISALRMGLSCRSASGAGS